MANLKLENLNKVYPNGVQAVFDFNLEIEDKEFVVFVGPSGCGKSTTLRMIAGLEDITSGDLYIDNEFVNDKVAKDRNIAMVFQSYALYPHMSVYDNMAFGLKLRKLPKDLIHEKVTNAAEILGLVPYLSRKPKALSGGQRQRVALGRAIVRNAKVFLMDEPLSNLDAKLRVQMRGELIKLHEKLATTTIYVTHDQIEAMTMATRLVVMKDGFIMQVGSPKEVYAKPNNIFVGGFLGTPPMNFLTGNVSKDGILTLKDGQKLKLLETHTQILKKNNFFNRPVVLGIRPEDLFETVSQANSLNQLKTKIDVTELLGSDTNIYANIGFETICAAIGANKFVHIGDEITLEIKLENIHLFNPETEIRLSIDEEPALNELEKVYQTMQEVKSRDQILSNAKLSVDEIAAPFKAKAKSDYETEVKDIKLLYNNEKQNDKILAKQTYQERLANLKLSYKEIHEDIKRKALEKREMYQNALKEYQNK